MNDRIGQRDDRVGDLRAAFDSAFAVAPPLPPPRERLLLVSAGQTQIAVPIRECAGVRPGEGVAALPSSHPAFRGLVAVAGALLPVYDVEPLLGVAATDVAARDRWLILAATPERVCFLVDAVDGYTDIPADETPPHDSWLTLAGTPRRMVSLAALAGAIAAAIAAGRAKE